MTLKSPYKLLRIKHVIAQHIQSVIQVAEHMYIVNGTSHGEMNRIMQINTIM